MRERVIFIVAIVAFIAIVPLVYYLLFERGLSVDPAKDQPPPVEEDAGVEEPPVPMALSLTRKEGQVELKRGDEPWQPAEVGTVLGTEDRVRTGPAASAILSMPGAYTVEMDSATEVGVGKLAEKVNKFLLKEGMISADVVDDPERLFEVAAAESLASTKGAAFKMSVDRQGLVSLGTTRGDVDIEAAGKVIKVSEGYLTRVVKGKPPQDPIKIPSKLYLKVAWPKERELSKRTLMVAGRTEKHARVKVGGVVVATDRRGRFRKRVSLKEGANRISVESYDIGGNHSKSTSPRMLVDTRPDGFQIRTSPEMWKKKQKPD